MNPFIYDYIGKNGPFPNGESPKIKELIYDEIYPQGKGISREFNNGVCSEGLMVPSLPLFYNYSTIFHTSSIIDNFIDRISIPSFDRNKLTTKWTYEVSFHDLPQSKQYYLNTYNCSFLSKTDPQIILDISDNKGNIMVGSFMEQIGSGNYDKIYEGAHDVCKYIVNTFNTLCKHQSAVDKFKINKNFFFVSPWFLNESACNELFQKYGVQFITTPLWDNVSFLWFKEWHQFHKKDLELPVIDNSPKFRKFTTLNWQLLRRESRIFILYYLIINNLINEGYVSFPDQCYKNIATFDDVLLDLYRLIKERRSRGVFPKYDSIQEMFNATNTEKVREALPLKLDLSDVDYSEGSTRASYRYQNINMINEYFNNSYIALVGECRHYTEKIFHPILAGIPFIVISSEPNNLQALKSLGYKTFHPVIDETYDTISSFEDRMIAGLTSFHNFIKDDIHDKYEQLIPILRHNQKVMISTEDNFKTNINNFLNQ